MKAIIRHVHSTHQLMPQVSFFFFFLIVELVFFGLMGWNFFFLKP